MSLPSPLSRPPGLYKMVDRDLATVSAEQIIGAAKTGWKRLHPGTAWPGIVDAVVGGPPCQGFSVCGKRAEGDGRNEQLRHFVRLVVAIRPRVFAMENVAGLLEMRFDSLREGALGELRRAGYRLEGADSYINAVDFGVPQARKRVVVLGSLDSVDMPTLRPKGTLTTVRDALDGLPTIRSYRALLNRDATRLNEVDAARRHSSQSPYARVLAGLDHDRNDHGYIRTWDADVITSSLRTVHQATVVQRFRRTKPGTVEPRSRLFRLSLDGVSRTLRAGTGSERGSHTSPRPIHPVHARVITVREAARLHGYPDWFRFHVTNWHGHRQVGNSVPPPLARAAGQAMLEALGVRPSTPDLVEPLGDERWLKANRLQAAAIVDADVNQLPLPRARVVI